MTGGARSGDEGEWVPRKTKARWRDKLAATKAGKRGGVPGLVGTSFDVPS